MKKFIVLSVIAVMLLAIPVFADDQKQDQVNQDLSSLFNQMHELRQQIIDKYVAGGQITQQQADLMKERMDQNFELRAEQGFTNVPGTGVCGGLGFGGGMQARGMGRGMGFGARGNGPAANWNTVVPNTGY
jgi:hypothetical protein